MLSVLLLILIPFKSFAYSNGNKLSVEVTPQSIPENTPFVDLLINFDTESEQYTEFNRQRLLDIENNELKISADREIATYNQDGYRSYLFHFVGASVDNQIEYHKFVFDNLSAIEKCKTLKVAFLDEKGSIIKITSEAKFTHVVFAETDSVIVDGDVARKTHCLSSCCRRLRCAGFDCALFSGCGHSKNRVKTHKTVKKVKHRYLE